MKTLAPEITRQRLLLEGYYEIDLKKEDIERYFLLLCKDLSLRSYERPILFSPKGEGKEENQGWDAFLPLIDSGISLYIWTQQKFFSLIIFTCKRFDENEAFRCTQSFFHSGRMTQMAF